jgi:phosphoribosylanthranilate isomerase
VLVKICGLTRLEDAAAAVAAGADLLGFVFRPGTQRALDPKRAEWLRELTGAATVGVFMDAPLDEVRTVRARLDLHWIQLHGNEPDSFLELLGSHVIRRVRADGAIDWERLRWLGRRCLPLFDPGAGDGRAWRWQILADRPADIRFGLAGGLTPANVAEAVRVVRPAMVDVSSGVEASPGIKDHARIRDFIAAARGALA